MKTIAFVSPFSNDPFAIVAQAYKNLYNKPFLAYYDQHRDTDHDKEYGLCSLALAALALTLKLVAC